LSRPDSESREIDPSKESHYRLLHAYELCVSQIETIAKLDKKPEERLLDWIEFIEVRVKVIWVLVPDYTNAFTIFETLNDRGLDLAISDLLKNYLFGLSANRLSEVQERWISMFSILEAIDSEDIVLNYIRHLWSSKYGLTRERDLYNAIKKKITSKQSAVDFSNELFEGSRIYAAIINTGNELWSHYGSTTQQHMSTLNLLGMVQVRPLLLAVLAEFDKNEVKKCLKLVVSWSVRFLISGGLGGGTLESYYSNAAKNVRAGKIKNTRNLIRIMKSIVPSNKQFEDDFKNARVSKNYLARYYLRVLENELKGKSEPELIPNPNEEIVNLEHILPRNPSTEWPHFEIETVGIYIRRIGNLALLSHKTNEESGNKSFSDKKKIYKKSKFIITSDITKYRTWSEATIERRQAELAKLAVNAWPITL
jgi:Protein of unknown function (DUF1524)